MEVWDQWRIPSGQLPLTDHQHRYLNDERDTRSKCWNRKQHQYVLMWERCNLFSKKSLNTEFWPWVFDRLIPVNCQVVIESCKGTFFTYDVVSLKQRRVLVHWAVTLNHSGVISYQNLNVYYCFDSPVACVWRASRQFYIWPQPAFRKLGTRSDFIAVHVTVVILLT